MHAARAGPQGVPQQTSPLKLGCILGGSAVRQRGQSWLYCLVLGSSHAWLHHQLITQAPAAAGGHSVVCMHVVWAKC